jgi:hypothetical protein
MGHVIKKHEYRKNLLHKALVKKAAKLTTDICIVPLTSWHFYIKFCLGKTAAGFFFSKKNFFTDGMARKPPNFYPTIKQNM